MKATFSDDVVLRKDFMVTALLLTIALALSLAAAPLGDDRVTHDGSIVSIDLNKLVLLEKPSKQVSYSVPDTVPITVMGKEVRLLDLKPGLQVRVTLDPKGDVASITTIDPIKIVGDFPVYR
jgi:hypothetical protein